MYYPGQVVCVVDKSIKELGIFLGMEENPKYVYFPNYYVHLFNPETGETDLQLYELKHFRPLLKESSSTITGTEVYYGPKHDDGKTYVFRKKSVLNEITDAEVEQNQELFASTLKALREEQWVKDNISKFTVK
jgi:hypothetical protein